MTGWRCAATSTSPPTDRDVWDPKAFVGATHVSEPERAALQPSGGLGPGRRLPGAAIRRTGSSATGTIGPATSTSTGACGSTWCWCPGPWPSIVTWALVDRNARKGKLPSDHAPVLVDVDGLAGDSTP